MNDLFKLVLSLSLSGSIISIIIFITKFIVKNKFSKSWQYYIWFILVLRLLLPFTVEINLVGSIFENNQINTVENTTHTEIKFNDTDLDTQPVQTYNNIEVTNESTDYLKLLTSNLWIIWIFGMLILLAIKIVDYRAFISYIRSSISNVEEEDILEIFDDVFIELKLKQNIDIYKSNIVKSPMLIGLFKPFIVIPQNNINLNELKYIFMHELTHFKRLHILYKWIVQILVCIHWFNPLMYFVNRDINKACELSCDESVLKLLNSEEKNIYGNILISIAQSGITYRNNVVSTTLCEDKKILKERLKSIMNFKKISKPTLCVSTALIVAIGSISVIVGAAPTKNIISQTNILTDNEIDDDNINEDDKFVVGNYDISEPSGANIGTAKNNDENKTNWGEVNWIDSIIDPPPGFDYDSVYSDDKLIASDDIKYKAAFAMYIDGHKFNEQEMGLHIGEAFISGAYTFFNVNLKSDSELTVKYKVLNDSDDFKIVLVTPDNKVKTIAQSGSGTQKLQLSKGRNQLKMVARNRATASIDFRFNKSEIEKLLAECADLESIVFLESYCDNADKYISDYVDNYDNYDLSTLKKVASSLNKDTLDKCVKNVVSRESTVDLESLKVLASYLSKDTVDFCIQKAIASKQDIDINVIKQLASYASDEVISSFIEKSAENNSIDLYSVKSLASYISSDSIDSAIEKYCETSSSVDLDLIRKLAPYATSDSIDKAINKYCETSSSVDLNIIRKLAPYATSSSIDYFIEKALLNKKSNIQ